MVPARRSAWIMRLRNVKTHQQLWQRKLQMVQMHAELLYPPEVGQVIRAFGLRISDTSASPAEVCVSSTFTYGFYFAEEVKSRGDHSFSLFILVGIRAPSRVARKFEPLGGSYFISPFSILIPSLVSPFPLSKANIAPETSWHSHIDLEINSQAALVLDHRAFRCHRDRLPGS